MGSTGSIGTQTLDIIRQYPDKFKAVALTANSQWALLAQQAREFKPRLVVIANEEFLPRLREALAGLPIEVEAGEEALCRAASLPETDITLTALVGYSGLVPTVAAIKAGKTIALANKETLVAGGPVIDALLRQFNSTIIPVDSEHSAIFQCLVGESTSEARKILLTASGGPFRTLSREDMKNVTIVDALRHPNWNMGKKVTIDSASMMNKGFEMIEAHWLFHCPPENIEILVHPQSIVHSMVEFSDGSVKAQCGIPDMHLPIRYALGYPHRLPDSPQSAISFSEIATLTFEKPDLEKFPMLKLAYEAINAGGNIPAALNAANEIGVASFLSERIRFIDMPELAETVMHHIDLISSPSLEDIINTHKTATKLAEEILKEF